MIQNSEEEYFSRPKLINDIRKTGQQKLKKAKVLVVGAGGLGCPALLSLAGAGIGTLGICDFDLVSISNLHRQMLYSFEDIGKSKAEIASQKLKINYPFSTFVSFSEKISSSNINKIISDFDIILDCTDNFDTRYLLDNFCNIHEKPLVYASIYTFEGQLTVFHLHQECSLKNAFPNASNEIPTCSQTGVLAAHTGILGMMQANEAIKIILGIGKSLSGKILNYNFLTNEQHIFEYQSVKYFENKPKYQKIHLQDFLEFQSENTDIQLIDVRTKNEFYINNLGGINISIEDLEHNYSKINFQKDIYIYCNSGQRGIVFANELFDKNYSSKIFVIH